MADFRIRKDAEDWFKHIADKSPFNTKFDLYYLCLMLGLAARRRERPSETTAFVDYFVEDYRDQELIIDSLLFVSELNRLGYGLDEREEIEEVLSKLLDKNGLNNEGVIELNAYASGGFEILLEDYGDAVPYSTEEFLPKYVKLLKETIESEPAWRT